MWGQRLRASRSRPPNEAIEEEPPARIPRLAASHAPPPPGVAPTHQGHIDLDADADNAVPDAGTGVSEWLFSSTLTIKEGHIETMTSMRTRMNPDAVSLSFCRFLPKRATPALAQVNSVT